MGSSREDRAKKINEDENDDDTADDDDGDHDAEARRNANKTDEHKMVKMGKVKQAADLDKLPGSLPKATKECK